MATRSEEFFHDKWLGMVQAESDGLVVAKPVLLEAQCAYSQSPGTQEKLREICPRGPGDAPRRIMDLMQFFQQLLDLDSDLFDTSTAIPDEVFLYAPEGPQTIRPTFGLLRQDPPVQKKETGSPASNAALKYEALVWDITDIEQKDEELSFDMVGQSLDKAEAFTGDWSYPAAAKFDRLLRHCRVPVGILTNREVIRLVYAPHGESSGHITFNVDDMASVGGRPILDAMIMLLNANQWFGVSEENALPSLLRRSREYQGTVTEDLAEQVFSGLEELLKGFQIAADRDQSGLLREALERDEDHLYRGLLTVMLRLVFILYAEDRNLLPVDHSLYSKQMSLLGLFERLQRDHGNFPDSMNNRFGAWGHIISLSRTIYLGSKHGDFHIPPRQGELFDPHIYPFLEGWMGGSAPVVTQKARSEVRVPTVDDGTVFALLRSLLIFQGQRLSYRTLDVEQIGSVYEALMGYRVRMCSSPAVAIKIRNKKGTPKFWVETSIIIGVSPGQRLKWLKDECGFDKPTATKIKKALDSIDNESLALEALLPLAAKKKEHEQFANVGQYVLQPGAERRSSGSNYTPRSLTEPIVRKTLEPLIRSLGEEPNCDQLLSLKVCDPAMGSGAFLVECCRQLADEVVASWGRAQVIDKIASNCPNGDVVAHARRIVAQRCLYGVDKNLMAVPLAKLSLWLFTLARDLPFTFLDHSLRHGDSLVGLNLEQIKSFHWKPEKQMNLLEPEIRQILDEVVAIRKGIHGTADNTTPEAQRSKALKLFDAYDATEKLRIIADVCIGAFFSSPNAKERLAERLRREDYIREFLKGDPEATEAMLKWANQIRSLHAPFHWWLEFPEVFYNSVTPTYNIGSINEVSHMDSFLGNPPFLGGLGISGLFGNEYRDWLFQSTEGAKHRCDLCAYFFRRSSVLLGAEGTLGFVATNTIAQGDTREGGLKHLLQNEDKKIYWAQESMPWPGDAAVTVSPVILGSSSIAGAINPELNGIKCAVINSRLRPKPEREDPATIVITAKCGRSQGSVLSGMGFILTEGERDELIKSCEANKECIFPFIGGAEVNKHPKQLYDRYVISFHEMSLEDAQRWPDLITIVEARVKPERSNLRADNASARALKKAWWRFQAHRPKLYSALAPLKRCLVTACGATKHLVFSFQPTDRVFGHSLFVFPLESFTSFAILQSRVHETWAWLLSSTMKNDLRYTASDCFDTFPFPREAPETVIAELEEVGRVFYNQRARFMAANQLGLTATYNAMKDFECDDERVLNLRRLHEEMDQAVLNAYGWSHIEVPPYCPLDQADKAAVIRFADDIIDCLHVLNAKRASDQK